MPRKRKRPILTAPLGPEGRKALADRVQAINAAADQAARAKLAKSTGRKAGKKPAARTVATATVIERELEQGERRWLRLLNAGAYDEADRVEATLQQLRRRLRRAEQADAKAGQRRARLDRFAVLVRRSAVLTDWHQLVADRWLEAIDAAADGLIQRAADPEAMPEDGLAEGGRDPVTGQRIKPAIDGPAIYVRGRSGLDKWAHGVPVAAVERGQRRKPETFDPKAVKAPRRAPGSSVPDTVLRRRGQADRLTAAFANSMRAAGHPEWCGAVAIRVILHNQGLEEAMRALAVGVGNATRNQAQLAVAAGLSGVAEALGLPVEK